MYYWLIRAFSWWKTQRKQLKTFKTFLHIMEFIDLLEYWEYNTVMYSYSLHEKDWLTRYKLRIDGKFPTKEIYSDKKKLSPKEIKTLIIEKSQV